MVGWRNRPKFRPEEHLDVRVIKRLINQLWRMEKLMSQLDTDVAALTDAVTTLTGVALSAIDALGHIVDTSADEAAVESANAAIADLTSRLAAAIPGPAPVDEPPVEPTA